MLTPKKLRPHALKKDVLRSALHRNASMHVVRRLPLAAPSWVIPAGLAENCQFLTGKVGEIGLLFFESAACLAYTQGDLPCTPEPYSAATDTDSETPSSCFPCYHVHLPLDLPWNSAQYARIVSLAEAEHVGEESARICLRLMELVRPLGVRRAVLHPPCFAPHCPITYAETALRSFARAWTAAGRAVEDLCLENIDEEDLCALENCMIACGYSVCVDFGHILTYGQERLLTRPNLLRRVRMVHWAFCSKSGKHLALHSKNTAYNALALQLLQQIPPETCLMLELFTWQDWRDSFAVLRRWLFMSEPHNTGKKLRVHRFL